MHILGCNTVYSERNKKTRKVITVISKCRDILSFDEAKCYCFDAKVTELCLQTIVVDMRFNIESYSIREKHSRLLSPSWISFCKNFESLEKWDTNFVLISVTVGCVTCFVECVTACSWTAMYAGHAFCKVRSLCFKKTFLWFDLSA